MREMPIWLDYAEFDDDGLCGISPNAPDEVKKAYEDYLAEEEEAKSKGIKFNNFYCSATARRSRST